jgi:hypothetical protein
MTTYGLTLSQQRKLEELQQRQDVIEHYLTKGGLLAVKIHRKSNAYPTGLYFFGRRGGDQGYRLYHPDGTLAYEEEPL